MTEFMLMAVVCLAAWGQGFAKAKEELKPTRKTASADAEVLHDSGQIQLKYDPSTFYVDGVDIRPRFFVGDSSDNKTYGAHIGNLNSEGGDFIVDNFRGNLVLKFVSADGRGKRTAVLSNGEKPLCNLSVLPGNDKLSPPEKYL